MNKTRVKKDENYWFLDSELFVASATDKRGMLSDQRYDVGNYFHTREQAEKMANKLRAVLKGADVIEMPSEEELRGFVKGVGKVSEETAYVLMKYYRWLKEKIVK